MPFTIVNVGEAEGQARLKALTGEAQAPVLAVGDKLVAKGYNEARWQAMLDEAGYPKTPAAAPRRARRAGQRRRRRRRPRRKARAPSARRRTRRRLPEVESFGRGASRPRAVSARPRAFRLSANRVAVPANSGRGSRVK